MLLILILISPQGKYLRWRSRVYNSKGKLTFAYWGVLALHKYVTPSVVDFTLVHISANLNKRRMFPKTVEPLPTQKRNRLAARCGFYRLAASCQQVVASLLNSSSCSKSVRIIFADLLQVVETTCIKLLDKKS